MSDECYAIDQLGEEEFTNEEDGICNDDDLEDILRRAHGLASALRQARYEQENSPPGSIAESSGQGILGSQCDGCEPH